MSEAILVAIITAVPYTVASMATVIISLMNRGQGKAIIKKTDQIHTLTNSNLTSVKEQLATANIKIASMEDIINELRGSRG
jgi:TolA-binding protein